MGDKYVIFFIEPRGTFCIFIILLSIYHILQKIEKYFKASEIKSYNDFKV